MAVIKYKDKNGQWRTLGSGFSPKVEITDIEGGHKVTIIDADGEESFDVMDGKVFTYEDLTNKQIEDLITKANQGRIKVLWSGSEYPVADDTLTLTELVSKQASGIVLVFSYCSASNTKPQNYNFHTFFINKKEVELHNGGGYNFIIANQSWDYVSNKYIYIYDDRLVGNDNNNKSGTGASGITFDNGRFVLRYVIGV